MIPSLPQSLLMCGIRFEGLVQHLRLVPLVLCLASIWEWSGTLEIDLRVPTNHLLPWFSSPAKRKGPGHPQDPRGSLEVLLSCFPSGSSLHAIDSSEIGEYQGTSPLIVLGRETQPWFPIRQALQLFSLPLSHDALLEETSQLRTPSHVTTWLRSALT